MKRKQAKAQPVQTVPCPAHGLPLELKEQDGKLVAVCNCDVKPNPHAGKSVVEMALTAKE